MSWGFSRETHASGMRGITVGCFGRSSFSRSLCDVSVCWVTWWWGRGGGAVACSWVGGVQVALPIIAVDCCRGVHSPASGDRLQSWEARGSLGCRSAAAPFLQLRPLSIPSLPGLAGPVNPTKTVTQEGGSP